MSNLLWLTIERSDPTTPQITWLLKSGAMDVFAVRGSERQEDRTRRYLFSVAAGDVLFESSIGLSNPAYRLLAVAIEAPILMSIPLSQTSGTDNWEALAAKWSRHLGSIFSGTEFFLPPIVPHDCNEEHNLELELATLHNSFSHTLFQLEQQELNQKRSQFYQQRTRDRQIQDQALSELVSVLDRQRLPFATEGDALLVAVGAVGHALGIDVHSPAQSLSGQQLNVSLETIARASQIRIRNVRLEEGWWKTDVGALLGYTKEKQPVALLPVASRQYEVFNPQNGTRTIVDQNVAETLSSKACVFYCPFPNQAITAFNVVRFALKGQHRDLLTVVWTGIAIVLLGMLIPFAIELLVDQAIPDTNYHLLLEMGLGLLVASFGIAGFQLAQRRAILRLQTQVDTRTQAALWDRLLKLRLSFFRNYSSGDLKNRVLTVSQIRSRLSGTTLSMLFTGLFALLNLAILFVYSSRLARLLLGFETPDQGAISYDNQDLSGLDLAAVRRQFGVVLQNGWINSASMFDNIASGAFVTLEEAWEAARLAGLAEDIHNMPMGMHTYVAKAGTNLSGGQRQRLLIARALIAKPKILLLDEATSALDNGTQAIVSRNLERLQVTRVVVAHRLSTIRHADRIYVLEAGRMVQQGTFEQLAQDQVVRIVKPKDWLPLGMMGTLMGVGLAWSFLGKLPMTVTGQGILINPRRVVPLQSHIAGQLQTLNVKDGQCVGQDQVLATIDPADLKQQLQQQQAKLAQLQQQSLETRLVRIQRTGLEREAIAAQRASLRQRLQNTQSLMPTLQTQGQLAIQQQRASLQQQLRDAQELAPVFEERLQNRHQLAQMGAIAQDALLQAEQEHRQAIQSIADIQAQLRQLDLQESESQQQYLNNLNQISEFQAQLSELETKAKQLEQNDLENTQTREKEIVEVQREIIQLEQKIAGNSQIKSPQSGCIVENTASAGQMVQSGTKLGTLQSSENSHQVIESRVVYFTIADGKRIQPGMSILITPDTVKRERFGSITGEVMSVSPLPITHEGATSVVGNSEVVDKLMGQQGGRIEVMAQLNLDPTTTSGYQWSSSAGPDLPLTIGTTVTARVIVEERAPVTFLLPLLREWSGIQ